MALSRPGGKTPGLTPRSRARARCAEAELETTVIARSTEARRKREGMGHGFVRHYHRTSRQGGRQPRVAVPTTDIYLPACGTTSAVRTRCAQDAAARGSRAQQLTGEPVVSRPARRRQ